MQIVTGARKCSYEQGAAVAGAMQDRGCMAIRILPGRFAAPRFKFLQEVAAVYRMPLDSQRELLQKVWREFDVALAGAEERVESIVRLHFAGAAMVAEVSRQSFADQCAALLDIGAKFGHGLLLEHYRIRQIDQLVLAYIIERDKIRLDVWVKEGLV